MKNNKIKQYKTVLYKEVKDAFRDKKSIIATFILPIIIFPVMFFLIGMSADEVGDRVKSPEIAIVSYDASNNINYIDETNEDYSFVKQILKDYGEPSHINCNINKVDDYSKSLIDGKVFVVVLVKENFKQAINNNGTAEVKLLYDDRSNSGSSTASAIASIFNTYNLVVGNARGVSAGVNINVVASQVTPLNVFKPDLTRYGTSNSLLQMLIPLLITMLISIGGMTIAVDLVAGEKERNTYEALLSTSANRMSILTAKFTVVILFSFLSAIAEVLSIGISAVLFKDSAFFGGGLDLNLPIGGILLVIINLFMLAGLFASLLMLLTASANTIKEANSKAMWITFIPMIIAYATIYMEVTSVNLMTFLIPIYNVVVSTKMLLAGVMNYSYVLLSLIANVAYAVISIFITLKMFNKEKLIVK